MFTLRIDVRGDRNNLYKSLFAAQDPPKNVAVTKIKENRGLVVLDNHGNELN